MSASPQRGYNHNIAHRGRVYHVQSEDSGTAKSHIYTHIFVNGTIIATNKVDYQPEVEGEGLAGHVVSLLQASHKKMIKQLRSGDLDQKIEVLLGGHPQATKQAANPAPEASESVAGPGPVLARTKIHKTPPARKTTTQQLPRAEERGTSGSNPVRHGALRPPLASSTPAQQWLSQQDSQAPSANESGGASRSEVKSRLEQLRQLLARDTPTRNPRQLDEELQELLADR